MDGNEDVFFSDDEDAENHGNAIRNIQLSPKKMSRILDIQLFSILMTEKEKPRDDILSTEAKEEDPYAEFDNLEDCAPQIPTPEQEYKPFQSNGSVMKNVLSVDRKGPSTPYNVIRQRRLKQLTRESASRKVKVGDEDDEYIPQSEKRRLLNGNVSNGPENDENVTPRILRPRKPQGNEDDVIPLAALKIKLLNAKGKDTPLSAGSRKTSSKDVEDDDIPHSALRDKLLSAKGKNTPLSTGSRKTSSKDVDDDDIPHFALRKRLLREKERENTPLSVGSRRISREIPTEFSTPKSKRRRMVPRKVFSRNGNAMKEKKRKLSNSSSECSPVDDFLENKAKRKKLSAENVPPPTDISASNDSADSSDESDEEYAPSFAKRKSGITSLSLTEEENTSRSRLRPRKSAWLEEDLIPLSVLKKSLMSAKKNENHETDQLVITPVASTA